MAKKRPHRKSRSIWQKSVALQKRKAPGFRKSLQFETLEPRQMLDASGFAGNDCQPELNLDAVAVQTVLVGQTLSFNIFAAGGTLVDLNQAGAATGDTLRTVLDPDVGTDTPVGATITEAGDFSWTPTAGQVGEQSIVVIAIDSGSPALADAETFIINVSEGTNQAPEIDLNGPDTGNDATATFTEDDGAVTIVGANLSLTDADSTDLVSASATITNLLNGTDELLSVVTTGTSINAIYDDTTGVLSLTGSDTVANYQQVLRTLTYDNASQNPDKTARSIDVNVSDGTDTSVTRTSSVTVVAVNDAPDLAPIVAQSTAVGQLIEITVTATDPEGDGLTFQLDRDATGATIPASATIASNGNTATISYTPVAGDGAGPFTFVVLVTDDDPTFPLSDSEQFVLTVTPAGAAPVIDLNGDGTGANFDAAFAEDGGEVLLVDTDLTVADTDSTNLTSATITITNLLDGTAESLSADNTGTSVNTVYFSATGVFSLFGTATVAEYQQVLRTLTYNNTSQNPTTTDRLISVIVSDGTNDSAPTTTTLSLTASNNSPNLTLPSPYNNSSTPVQIELGQNVNFTATVVDPDNVPADITFQLDLESSGIGETDAQPTITTPPTNVPGGAFSWTPSVLGTFTITVLANDGLFPDQQSFTVEVVEPPPAAISAVTPQDGEQDVRLDRAALRVTFDTEIDPTTVTSEVFYATVAGQQVAGQIRIGSDSKSIAIYPDEMLPSSTTARLVVDGNKIRDMSGTPVDGNGDGAAGGVGQYQFSTVGLTRLAGTSVFGYIYDSTRTGNGGADIPIVGVTLSVEGLPELTATTDENGFFRLQDTPGGEFFVHFDTSTVTSAPAGFKYLAPTKPFHPVPGMDVQLGKPDGKTFDIYFPLVDESEGIDVTQGQMTVAQFGTAALDHLEEIAPGISRSEWEKLKVEIPPDSLFFEDGTPADEVQIFALDPKRIPAPLPGGVDPTIVFSIDAGGASDFGTPAKLTFPNVDGLAPGEVRPIYTFDHDAGEWKITGRAVVSADGSVLVTDEGGVTTLGWKAQAQLPGVRFQPEDELEPIPDFCDPDSHWDRLFDESYEGLPELPDGTRLQTLGTESDKDYWARYDEVIVTIPADKTRDAGFTPEEFLSGMPRDMNSVPSGEGGKRFREIADFSSFDEDPEIGDVISPDAAGMFSIFEQGKNDVMLTEKESDYYRFSTLETERAGQHIYDGSRIWGQQTNDDGSVTYYSRGVDRNSRKIAPPDDFFDTGAYPIQDELWESLMQGIGERYGMTTEEAKAAMSTNRGFILDPAKCMEAPQQLRLSPADFGSVHSHASSPGIAAISLQSTRVADLISGARYRLTFFTDAGFTAVNTIRGIVEADGNIPQTVSSGTRFDLHIWQPSTNLYYYGTGVTDGSGGVSTVSLSESPSGPDNDFDGIGAFAEYVIGTLPSTADSDGDGISDGAEIAQGLNPLDGIAYPSGIIGNTQPSGEVKDIAVEGDLNNASQQTAYLATGSHGLAIVDVSQFINPSLLGEIDLLGNVTSVAVDTESQIAYVAAGFAGVHYVDVSDPLAPVLIRTISEFGAVTKVGFLDGTVVVAGQSLGVLDRVTGEILSRVNLPNQEGRFTDFFQSGDTLFAVSSNSRLHSIAFGDGSYDELDSTEIPVPPVRRIVPEDMRLFVANGVAYISNGIETELVPVTRVKERGGYTTFNVSDPSNLSLISDIELDDLGNDKTGNLQTVLNGSGLAVVAAGSVLGLQVQDASDPSDTYTLLNSFATPGTAEAVAVVGGIAFVADGPAGLQVINYRDFDALGNAPTVTIDTDALDADPGTAGVQVEEGTTVRITPTITDDVQVRTAELLVDGVVVQNDLSFPYEFTAVVPNLSSGVTSIDVQVRATDTGGNSSLSNLVSLEIVPDTIAPTIDSIGPFRTQEGFFGKELQIEVRSPDLSTRIGSPVTVTVGPSIEIVDLSTQVGEAVVDVRYDISDKRIEADFSGLRVGTFGTGDFNGIVFSDVADTISPIIGVTLDPSMNSMGLTADDIQFDGNSIRIDVSGKRYTRDSLLAVNVEFASDPANVPFISEGQRTLEVRFSEPLAAGSVAAGFTIEGAGPDEVLGTPDDILVNTSPTLRSNDKVVRINSELTPGSYRLVVDESVVTDRAGNAVGNSTFTRTFQVREVVPLFQGDNPDIVFAIDVSGSANDPFEGTPVGDINNDGRSNTILDAELANVLLLSQELVSLGFGAAANISIVPFSGSASALDMNPFVDGIQLTTNPGADADGNGIGDVEQALRSLTAGGGTDFSDALDVAISTFDQLGTVSGEGNLIFMSDGSGGGGFTSQLQSLRDRNVKIRAFGVGDGADLASLRALDAAAEQFSSTDEFLNAIFGDQ